MNAIKKNESIEARISELGIRKWQIARELGITDNRLSIWFRDELDPERKELVNNAIDRLSKISA